MHWIANDRDLQEICAQMPAGSLGLDTEFVRRTTYYPILALIQVSAEGRSWLIDAPGIETWQPLVEILHSRELIMHSASEDLEVFRTSLNTLPDKLFDTQVAAAFVGLGPSLSYAALVETLLNVSLEKSQTQSNWLKRPLSEAQKSYAEDDVRYLHSLYEILGERLEQQGKTAWFEAYQRETLEAAARELDPALAYRRVKNAATLSAQQLSLLAELAEWRETRARSLNKPRNWLVRDPEMLKIVRQRPRSRADLDQSIGMAPESIRRYAGDILSLVSGHATTRELEPLPPPLSPAERGVLKLLQARVEQLAADHQIAGRLIANKAELEELIRYKQGGNRKPQMLSDWRAEQFAPQIEEMVNV